MIQPDSSPALSFTAYPENNACDEVVLRIKGGSAPFTISVLAGQSGQYANVTNQRDRTVRLRNTVPAGQTFHSQSAIGVLAEPPLPVASRLTVTRINERQCL